MHRLLAGLTIFAVAWLSPPAAAAESAAALRVAVIGASEPMSYRDARGKLTGFNVELARELCATMKHRCEVIPVALGEVVETVARGDVDFAAVSLVVTPERSQRVLFTKPYYRSVSVWVSAPAVGPGAANASVAVVRGGVQAGYARSQGWRVLELDSHAQIPEAAAAGRVNATLVPMLTGVGLIRNPAITRLGWTYRLLTAPEISGDVSFPVAPRRPELRDRLNGAIDQVRTDGRFDRVNSEFLPFRLQ